MADTKTKLIEQIARFKIGDFQASQKMIDYLNENQLSALQKILDKRKKDINAINHRYYHEILMDFFKKEQKQAIQEEEKNEKTQADTVLDQLNNTR